MWRRGSVVGSWLLDLTAAALLADPDLDGFHGRVSDSGEGRWTLHGRDRRGRAGARAVGRPVRPVRVAGRGGVREPRALGDAQGVRRARRAGARVKPAETPEWASLVEHAAVMRQAHLRGLFADDPHRAERLSAEAGELFLDYSKHIVTDETVGMLLALADAAGLRERIDAMFAGERVNVTEDRAALHVALRAPRGTRIEVDGHDVVPDVHEVLDRMSAFAERVRTGEWTGATGERMRAVVNIGIGGSDLGPHMAVEALRDSHRSRHDLPVRLERRRRRHRRGHARPRPGDDLVHRVVEDVRHDRDAHERAQRARLAAGRPRRRRGRRRAALRRGLDRARRRCGRSASTPRTCSGSGTGSAAATRWIRRSGSRS